MEEWVMAIYEYECDAGHTAVISQSISDDALTECPFKITVNQAELEGIGGYGKPIKQHECGAPCRRLVSKSSFVLKGGGWTGKGS